MNILLTVLLILVAAEGEAYRRGSDPAQELAFSFVERLQRSDFRSAAELFEKGPGPESEIQSLLALVINSFGTITEASRGKSAPVYKSVSITAGPDYLQRVDTSVLLSVTYKNAGPGYLVCYIGLQSKPPRLLAVHFGLPDSGELIEQLREQIRKVSGQSGM
jgi:hypothetical protein